MYGASHNFRLFLPVNTSGWIIKGISTGYDKYPQYLCRQIVTVGTISKLKHEDQTKLMLSK